MYISEESKIAPTIVVLFSFPGFRFTDKVLHYLIFGASYTKRKLVFLSLPKKSFTYTYGLIFGASYTNKKAMLLTSKVPTLKLILSHYLDINVTSLPSKEFENLKTQ